MALSLLLVRLIEPPPIFKMPKTLATIRSYLHLSALTERPTSWWVCAKKSDIRESCADYVIARRLWLSSRDARTQFTLSKIRISSLANVIAYLKLHMLKYRVIDCWSFAFVRQNEKAIWTLSMSWSLSSAVRLPGNQALAEPNSEILLEVPLESFNQNA